MTLQEVLDKIKAGLKWFHETLTEVVEIALFQQDWFESHIVLVILALALNIGLIYVLLWMLFGLSKAFIKWLLHLKRYFTNKEYKTEYNERKKKEKQERLEREAEEWKHKSFLQKYGKRIFWGLYFGTIIVYLIVLGIMIEIGDQ